MKITIDDVEMTNIIEGTTYEEICKKIENTNGNTIVAVSVNNQINELTHTASEGENIKTIDTGSRDGQRIYQRSLSLILVSSFNKLFPDNNIYIKHSLSGGLYCEYENKKGILKKDVENLEKKMQELIDLDIKIQKIEKSTPEAQNLFREKRLNAKVDLLKFRKDQWINLYECHGEINYFYGYMVPSTGYIKAFDIIKYDEGLILRFPSKKAKGVMKEFKEAPQIAEIFKERDRWGSIVGVEYVSDLNNIIDNNKHVELMQIVEALHEKKVAQIADEIFIKKKRVILIAGPSSSGKTTFANRLKIQLKVLGANPITVSMDNYFVQRELTPLDEFGEYDYESIRALDKEQLNDDISRLLDGEEISLPKFDFKSGSRYYTDEKIKISENQQIIIEGIHGLNEELTSGIFRKDKFKIYISALTQLNIDEHNRIPTTQSRLIRRIVRDNNFRGHSAKDTIAMWDSVRRGEDRNIFPFQEDADVMFNSALPHELSVLKKHAKPILEAITIDDEEYSEANLLLKFLAYFKDIDDDSLVPNTSILKEFIGGSNFDV